MNIDKIKHIFGIFLQYLIPYLLGILFAIVFTPIETSIAGHSLLHIYPILAIPAFFFIFTLFPTEFKVIDWVVAIIYFASIACILFGIVSHFGSLRYYRRLGAKLIGFSFGFVGTFGVYYIAAASI